MTQTHHRLSAVLLTVALLCCGGCDSQECASSLPAVRLELSLASGITGAGLVKLRMTLRWSGQIRVREVGLSGELADGETTLELALRAFAGQGFSGTLEVRALDGAGNAAASASRGLSVAADQCVTVGLILTRGDLSDGGPPPPDGPGKDGPPPDRAIDDGSRPDRAVADGPGPRPDRSLPKPDKSSPKPDKSSPKPDKSLPKPDKSPPKPDLPTGPCGGKPNGTSCTGGKCLNGSCCTGCIKNNACYSGSSTSSCGLGGVSCSTCSASNTCRYSVCQSGVCGTKAQSNGTSCTGGKCVNGACCTGCIDANGTCQAGASVSVCGQGGATCKKCTSNSECNDPICSSSGSCGATTSPTGKVCSTGKCYKGNCCSGCVGNYACQPGTSVTYCGSGGGSCGTCSTTHPCKTAVCGPPCTTTPKPAGTACPTGKCSAGGVCNCSSSSQCANNKTGVICKQNAICGCYSNQECPHSASKTCKTSTGFCY